MAQPEADTFCPLPWVHRFTNIGGEIQVCCTSEEYAGDILADDGRPLTILEATSDSEILNTRFMRELRQKMTRGEWPSSCERCRLTEAASGHSRRYYENLRFGHLRRELVDGMAENGAIRPKILLSDYRLGNLCNLACRMCNPRSSSAWIRDWKKVNQSWFQTSDTQLETYTGYDWYERPEVWEAFRKQLPTLTHLHFAGGEPLIVPQMIEALRLCVESGRAGKIQLSYNTNLTRIPRELEALWPEFEAVILMVSADAFGALNDYIRHPSRWETIDRNFRHLDANAKRLKIIDLQLMTTVQAYNVLSLEPLYDYLAEGFVHAHPAPLLVGLHHPEHYRTQILPADLKQEARRSLESIRRGLADRLATRVPHERHASLLASIDEAIEWMEMEDRSELWPEFARVAASKDAMRRQSLKEVAPELNRWLPALG